jgi:catechol 2,3-dioxygenase-like lactoylglutathione lyase family enzyme
MIDHITLTVTDLARTRRFYERALAPLGWSVLMEHGPSIGLGPHRPYLWLKQGETPSVPMHIAFATDSRKAVDAFHKAALEAGGRDYGPPGPRPEYHPHYYGAFVFDVDGHPIEAVCHLPDRAPRKSRRKTTRSPAPKKKAPRARKRTRARSARRR